MLDIKVIQEYIEKKDELNKLKEEVKGIRLNIINNMEESDRDKEIVGNYVVSISKTKYKDVKNEKLECFLNYLKEHNLEELVFETYDKKGLTNSINKGILHLDDIIDYVDIRIQKNLLIRNKN